MTKPVTRRPARARTTTCQAPDCGKAFAARRTDTRFCSGACRARASRDQGEHRPGQPAPAPADAVIDEARTLQQQTRAEVAQWRAELRRDGRLAPELTADIERFGGAIRELRDDLEPRLGDAERRLDGLDEAVRKAPAPEKPKRSRGGANKEWMETVVRRLDDHERALFNVAKRLAALDQSAASLDERADELASRQELLARAVLRR